MVLSGISFLLVDVVSCTLPGVVCTMLVLLGQFDNRFFRKSFDIRVVQNVSEFTNLILFLKFAF